MPKPKIRRLNGKRFTFKIERDKFDPERIFCIFPWGYLSITEAESLRLANAFNRAAVDG